MKLKWKWMTSLLGVSVFAVALLGAGSGTARADCRVGQMAVVVNADNIFAPEGVKLSDASALPPGTKVQVLAPVDQGVLDTWIVSTAQESGELQATEAAAPLLSCE